MRKDITAICVPSGPSGKVDLDRANTAIQYWENHGQNIPFEILGAGPDLNSVLGYLPNVNNPDHHKRLYTHLLNNTNEIIGLDI